jgi:glucuronosyltransferase
MKLSETANITKNKNSFDMMICVVSLFILPAAVESLKIVAEFPHSGKSHLDVLEPCLEQLAARGHQLLVISHFPRTHPSPNYDDTDMTEKLPTNKKINKYQ